MIRPSSPSHHDETPVYHCAPSIIWTRELDQTCLIDKKREMSWMIQGIEATIWDLLVLAYPYQRGVAFLAALLDVTVEKAKDILLATLARWQQQGIVEVSTTGHDQSGNQ